MKMKRCMPSAGLEKQLKTKQAIEPKNILNREVLEEY